MTESCRTFKIVNLELGILYGPKKNFVKYHNLLKGSDQPLILYFPVAKKISLSSTVPGK